MHVDLSREELAVLLRSLERSLTELTLEQRSLGEEDDAEEEEEGLMLADEHRRLEAVRQKLTQVRQAGVGDTDSGGQLERPPGGPPPDVPPEDRGRVDGP